MSLLDDIEELALDAMDEHGLISDGWTFKWDNAKCRFGSCRYGARQVSLSRALFSMPENQDQAVDTILHEIAHALAGPGAHHGPVWQALALEIGAVPSSCAPIAARAPYTVVADCDCGQVHGRYQMPRRGYSYTCRRTGQALNYRRVT